MRMHSPVYLAQRRRGVMVMMVAMDVLVMLSLMKEKDKMR